MAKNSVKQMMVDERRVLDNLQRNANKSINEIAKICGFSRQKVWRIIKNLERTKTVWGYTAIIDEAKQNQTGFIALIKRTNQPLTKEFLDKIVKREIVKKTAKSGIKVTSSFYVNGAYDWVISFSAKDIKDAKRFVEYLTNVFQGTIDEIKLLENIFVVSSCGIQNPDIEKFYELFPDL